MTYTCRFQVPLTCHQAISGIQNARFISKTHIENASIFSILSRTETSRTQ